VGDIDGAERRLRDAIDADPALVDAYEQLGRLYLSEHRLEEAQAQFSAALQRRPSSVSGRTMLGVILEIRGRSSEAERAYEQVLEANPTAAVAANNLAWLYAERGANLDVALRRAQEAKRQLTDNPKVNDTLGWVYYKKGMISEAVTALCESIDRDPSDPQAQFHAGLALLKNGDLLRARQALERALALDANFENAADTRAALSRLGSS